jgi:dTDP-L-rhamnose 4-epimerase
VEAAATSPRRALITGGAGFIGSHLADELIARGHRVRVLDLLCPQVHGADTHRPNYLHPEVELLHGDVRDPRDVRLALDGIDAVYHFAAAVGVGQSMYEVDHYTSTNNLGTAILLQELARRPVQRLVVASSIEPTTFGTHSSYFPSTPLGYLSIRVNHLRIGLPLTKVEIRIFFEKP